jgi:diphthamide biosynthesis protein 2
LTGINGIASPGAEFLRTGRSWQGLGTDFDNEQSTAVEPGRSGIARGYTAGEDSAKH